MRIRHVLPQPAMGTLPYDPLNEPMTGVVGTAWSLATTQACAGHQVEIVAPGLNGPRSGTFAGVRVDWLPQWHALHTKRIDASYLVPLWLHTLRSPSVDIAHVHGNPYFSIRYKSRGRVLHVNDSSIQPGRKMEQALARSDRILCCSSYIRNELLGRVDYLPERVHIFFNGVDWQLHASTSRSTARTAFEIADGDISHDDVLRDGVARDLSGQDRAILVFAGRNAPEKGLTVLLAALKKLSDLVTPAPMLLVAGTAKLGVEGAPAMWGRLEAYERETAALAENLPVRFVGNLPRCKMPLLYSAGDVFVSPSLWQEPFGMVNVEAQACGVPVVASAVGGIPDVVQHEVNGLLVPPGNPQALAEALHRLIVNPELRTRLGRTARETSASMDWGRLVRKLDGIYDEVLKQNPALQGMAAQ